MTTTNEAGPAGAGVPQSATQRVMGPGHVSQEALHDVVGGLAAYPIWIRFAYFEIRQRFRRSLLGPLWLTMSMAVMIGALGLVFSTLFALDIRQTMPYIACGIIFWGLMSSCIIEGTTAFVGSEAYIRNVPLPVSLHYFRMLARNVIVWGFNMIIYVLVVPLLGVRVGPETLLFIPGFVLFVLNAAWMGLFVGILSTRFRDIPPIVGSVIQVVFFVTPVFWSVTNLPRRPAFVELNPFYHLLEIVRAPLLGASPAAASWLVACATAAVGFVATGYLYKRAYARIAYWV